MRLSPGFTFAVAVAAALCVAPCRAEDRVLMSLPRLGPDSPYRIVEVDAAARKVRIQSVVDNLFFGASEGLAILVVPGRAGAEPDTVVRVEVTEILPDASFWATFGPGAVGVVRKGPVLFGRPFGGAFDPAIGQPPPVAGTKALRALPDMIAPGGAAGAAGGEALADLRAASIRLRAQNNLKMLALALLNYESAHRRLPPAVIFGPDGRPWHSWRVLILPYIEQNRLYEQYDFSQPWDSPKNRPIADTVIDVFRDPARPGDDAFTDYALLVGKSAMFDAEGVSMKSPDDFPACLSRGGTKISQVIDGLSNTLLVATVAPGRRIPWTSPEDIAVKDGFPGIGTPDGIAALHPAGDEKVTIVAFGDGSVRPLPESLDDETGAALVSRDVGEVIDWDAIPLPELPYPPQSFPMVLIREGADGKPYVEVE